MSKILVITKRQYTNKDLLDDRFGRIWELPLELAIRKHVVYGLCLSYRVKKEGKFPNSLVEWESINAKTLKIPCLLRFIKRAAQLARKVDAIWACSDSFYGIIGYMLSLKYHIPLVFDLYDNFEYFLLAKIPVIKQLYRRVLRKSDAVTCVSLPLARLVKSYGRKDRLFVLENAVRKDLFMPIDKESCRNVLKLPQNVRLIGTAGALTKNRGIHSLFEAFDTLKSKYPDLHLTLAGPRDIQIPHSDRIHDLGILKLEKVPLFYNALDVGVICNRNDDFGRYCFPQKAREIMACNIPIVAARVGSMEELFADHPEWLFIPENGYDLGRVLENRLQDPRTAYGDVPSWSDAAAVLEKVLFEVCLDQSWR